MRIMRWWAAVLLLVALAACRHGERRSSAEAPGLAGDSTPEVLTVVPPPGAWPAGSRSDDLAERYEKALARYERGDASGAIGHCRKGLAELSSWTPGPARGAREARFLVVRGLAWTVRDEAGPAVDDFTQAIELDPRIRVDALCGRGVARLLQGDSAGSIADFTAALRIAPDVVAAYNDRGNAKALEGDLQGALVDYAAALELNPRSAVVERNRARARLRLGDPDGALEHWGRARALDPAYDASPRRRDRRPRTS